MTFATQSIWPVKAGIQWNFSDLRLVVGYQTDYTTDSLAFDIWYKPLNTLHLSWASIFLIAKRSNLVTSFSPLTYHDKIFQNCYLWAKLLYHFSPCNICQVLWDRSPDSSFRNYKIMRRFQIKRGREIQFKWKQSVYTAKINLKKILRQGQFSSLN